ncbi:MAG: dehydrogenase [Actinomyces sp.]|nr:MAG: dehydrogenase [Actinomyces sp.]
MTLTEDEVRAAVAALLEPRDPDAPATVLGAGSDDLEAGRRWLSAAAASGGWAVPTWPRRFGGRDATPDEARLIARVLRDFAVPDLYPYAVGLSLVGPILLESGTPAQQERWLRAIADGSEIWCQMFSEPDAGSDLANLATRAVRDGDEWILEGQKVWTSRGLYSRWGMCLARTDPDVPKHRGITMFAVDMTAPGVEVRPLHQMNGDEHFTEVFLSEVRVPDADRLSDLGGGWAMAMEVFAHERASLGGSGGGLDPGAGEGWLHRLAREGALADPVRRDRAMRILGQQRIADWTARRLAAEAERGGDGGSGGPGGKLRQVAIFKARTDLAKDAQGPAGMLTGEGHVEFLTGPSMSIRGGTDEIQHNIIGERILGLPPEPRVDKGVPYAELRRQGLT